MGARSRNLFEGKLVRLRGVEPEDADTFHTWNADTEAARSGYRIPFPVSREQQRQWAARVALQEGADDTFLFLIETLACEAVGSLSTHACDRRNGTFSYGVFIAAEHRHHGYAHDAIHLLLDYFFRELRYQKATVRIYSFNEPSLALHMRLGFVQEGRLRRMIFTGGQFHDEILLGMTAEEFDAKNGPRRMGPGVP
ncbi:MAG TPA: GNAT family N-acetyltransferase [Ktedonobacterales bacterium]